MARAVLFDVDGTLVDTVALHAEAWAEAFGWYGKRVPLDAIRKQIGKGGDQLLPVFFSREELDRFGDELQRRRSELYAREYLPRARPFPGAHDLVARVHRDRKAAILATSARKEELGHLRKLLGLEGLVDAVTTADDVDRSKPYPDIFRAALGRAPGVPPAEAVVVGDSPYDVEAAARAGIPAVGVLTGGFGAEELRRAGCVAVYRDVADLLAGYDASPLAS